jgi:hypothetical protein
VFTARYAMCSYIKQTRFVFKGLILGYKKYSKNIGAASNFRCQKGDMKQVPY